MVSFVHIADKNDEQAILKAGIKAVKRRSGLRGVYAMPVVPNFATTASMGTRTEAAGESAP